MLTASQHAVERYQERVANVPDEEARAQLTSPLIQRAAAFGASIVRLGTGHRVLIRDNTVITVLPTSAYARQVQRHGLGRFGTSTRTKRRIHPC